MRNISPLEGSPTLVGWGVPVCEKNKPLEVISANVAGPSHELIRRLSYSHSPLTSPEMMIQKIEYIHQNPAKRGYVDEPEHWRYSSARNYLDMVGLIPVTLYEG